MTYVDATFTPEATYTYVNLRQLYDSVAGALTTHPAWDFVEYVDSISAPYTYRRYVWKCNSAQSGLSADFFVVFQVGFTTTGTVWGTGYTDPPGHIRVFMGETYTGGVLGKFVSNGSSITIAADLTNPAAFSLATYSTPSSIWNATNLFSVFGGQATSYRMWFLVTKDSIILSRAGNSASSPSQTALLYVGAYESIFSPVVDALPIILIGTTQSGVPYIAGGSTRALTMTPSTTYTEVFSVAHGTVPGGSSEIAQATGSWASYGLMNNQGIVGNPSDTNWNKSIGGPVASKLVIGTGCTSSNRSTKGIFRGYLKNVVGANYATHAYGDTFLVDGKVYVGTGSGTYGSLVNTEAV